MSCNFEAHLVNFGDLEWKSIFVCLFVVFYAEGSYETSQGVLGRDYLG